MLIQSSHSTEDRGLDAYFSPPEAAIALIKLEKQRLPTDLWEPACGNGALVYPLRNHGYCVVASDVHDYGCESSTVQSYFSAKSPFVFNKFGIVTNPPYRLALEFARKAVSECNYVALLLRTNFLESVGRMIFFKNYPPSRVWISSRRLPMMHRHGWDGPKAPSNTCHAWFIWDQESPRIAKLCWFDWKDYV